MDNDDLIVDSEQLSYSALESPKRLFSSYY